MLKYFDQVEVGVDDVKKKKRKARKLISFMEALYATYAVGLKFCSMWCLVGRSRAVRDRIGACGLR